MYAQVEKLKESKSRAVADFVDQKKNIGPQVFRFVDNRPESIAQRKIHSFASDYSSFRAIQKKENNTGLPDNLKSGIENLSGCEMDDVKVHHNSDSPRQLEAYAYAQGTNIHITRGQEQRLAHEAWHVVQQRQGRVQPTTQLIAQMAINDGSILEQESDVLSTQALNYSSSLQAVTKTQGLRETESLIQPVSQLTGIIQRVQIEPKGIQGLTHLVKMTGEGHIYIGENWLENEKDEVKTGDKLLVDMDDAWYSHRGINQETNWQRDGKGDQDHLWVGVVELNHRRVEDDLYVREEMLSDGWPKWEEAPKKMHSIWVQGDVSSNKEAMEGITSRRGQDTEGWTDMIWFYDTGVNQNEYKTQEMKIDSKKIAPLMKRSFRHEMKLWEKKGTMPDWVKNWLPILDILYKKKSYITMSDLMRMIILYYEGGVYLDVKIKVETDKAIFKERPMVKIDTANFYKKENWAIMAHSGCKMLEDMMIEAYKQFPKEKELERYPANYQEESESGKRRKEGKMHVELHENLGVWNVIDKKGRPQFPTSLNLSNPRPVNSWSEAYEDRPLEVVKKEQNQRRKDELGKLSYKITQKTRDLEHKKQLFDLGELKQFWERNGITQKIMDELPTEIETLEKEIKQLESDYKLIEEKPFPEIKTYNKK